MGRHLIQAFASGEITPEQAHEIGMKLANEVLGGKYEFVLTTHIEKGHIHNHIIFNSVSFVDYRKYHSNKRSYHFIRRTSDRLCKDYGLSVIVPGQDKGKSYIEHTTEKAGTSYKAKLKAAIDRLLSAIKAKEQRIGEIGLLIKHVSAYRANRPVYERYRKSSDKEKFLRGQESQIILFESAAKALKQMGVQKLPDIAALKKDGLPRHRETAGVWELPEDQNPGKGTGYHQAKCGPALSCPAKGRTGEEPGTRVSVH